MDAYNIIADNHNSILARLL